MASPFNLAPELVPLTIADTQAARARGWWLGRIEEAAPGRVRLLYVFLSGRSVPVTIPSAQFLPATVYSIAEAIIADRHSPRPGRGRR